MPYTDIALPNRTKLRNDRELAMWVKSNTEKEDPRRATPYTETVLPKRKKDRKDSADPRVTKYSTERDEPKRATP